MLVWVAPSMVMNPSLDRRVIDAALARDEVVARREWYAEFSETESAWVTRGALARYVVEGRGALEPRAGCDYMLFVDAASGSGADAMTWSVSHLEETEDGRIVVVIDRVEALEPPFDPSLAARPVAGMARGYGVHEAIGDRYAQGWLETMLGRCGLRYRPSPLSRSELYLELLPLLNCGAVEFPDDRRLVEELAGRERRASSGRETVDHAAGRHDDRANACAGAAVLAYRAARTSSAPIVW